MFKLFGKGHQPKKPGNIMPPPTPYKPDVHIHGDITTESAERIAEALRDRFGEPEQRIEYDESEFMPSPGIAARIRPPERDVFERRLELLDRLILIHDKDQYADYSEEISDVVTALMKDCDINPDTSDGETP